METELVLETLKPKYWAAHFLTLCFYLWADLIVFLLHLGRRGRDVVTPASFTILANLKGKEKNVLNCVPSTKIPGKGSD